MKTTVRLKLRTSNRMPGGGVLALHITRHRITRTVTTSCVLSVDEWDENRQSVIFLENTSPKRKKELEATRRKLKKYRRELHETVKLLESHGDYSSQELVCLFRERQQGQMFCTYINRKVEMLQQNKRFGTAHAYQYAAVSFLKFLGDKDIRIDKIDAALMKDYERYLITEGKSQNTVSCYMRSLRAAYNAAIREKVFAAKKSNENPFSKVFTGNAKTRKRAISGESISQLAEVKAPELTFSRDLFLFSFYTQGMSFSDMVDLKKENIKNGVIRYKRKKTGQLISIELEDCMKEIIERYQRQDSDFIFPILKGFMGFEGFKALKGNSGDYEKWKQTANALAAYNKNLKKLAALANISEHLTSYVSRHSWATMASHVGIPIATISRGLGHESEKTTQIYISRADYSDVGRANKQILSRIRPAQSCA